MKLKFEEFDYEILKQFQDDMLFDELCESVA